ncbi:MAG TPA: nucleotide exchange factor GrpE [Kofleriaceae bacterium]|jgi:molecular chaperone GrpE (heat shock protein)|nr:nucleotide exchange factor GrpE [Kofleriaceae bacterium]
MNPETGEHAVPDVSAMRRALNELEAAKARVERDAQQVTDQMRAKLVVELLPLLDDLDRTVHAAELAGDAPMILSGVQQVRAELQAVLARHGVERVDAKYLPFDPSQHEAVSVVAVSHPAAHGVVIDQIQPGYRFGDRLLRPARVVVGRLDPPYH